MTAHPRLFEEERRSPPASSMIEKFPKRTSYSEHISTRTRLLDETFCPSLDFLIHGVKFALQLGDGALARVLAQRAAERLCTMESGEIITAVNRVSSLEDISLPVRGVDPPSSPRFNPKYRHTPWCPTWQTLHV